MEEVEITGMKITGMLSDLSVKVENGQYEDAIMLLNKMKGYWNVFKVSQNIAENNVDEIIRRLETFLRLHINKAKQVKNELLDAMQNSGVVIL